MAARKAKKRASQQRLRRARGGDHIIKFDQTLPGEDSRVVFGPGGFIRLSLGNAEVLVAFGPRN